MRNAVPTTLTAVGVGATLAVGFAVAALASSGSTTRATTTSETSTTEHAMSVHYAAPLAAAAEVPKPTKVPAGAGGTFAVTLTHTAGKYTGKWKLTFHGLSGGAKAAHIHAGKSGKAGNVIVPLCTPCKSPVSGTTTFSKAVSATIASGGAYVNVHTAKNLNGEIRGQIAKMK